MLVGKRRQGWTLLERHIVYDLIENGNRIGLVEYGPNNDFVETHGRRYCIVPGLEGRTILQELVKQIFGLWKATYLLKDDAGKLVARIEKSTVDTFTLHYAGTVFLIGPPEGLSFKSCIEVRRQNGAVIGEVERKGLINSELVSTLPPSLELPIRALVMWMLVFRVQNAPSATSD